MLVKTTLAVFYLSSASGPINTGTMVGDLGWQCRSKQPSRGKGQHSHCLGPFLVDKVEI